MKVLLFFIDGFGIGPDDSDINPLVSACSPTFDLLFNGQLGYLVPTDTSQGVEGIPQSATGQTALLTGTRAAQFMGRHISGFPGPALRRIISEQNILKRLKSGGKKVTFANAYTPDYLKQIHSGHIQGSVTTVATLSAGIPFRTVEQIPAGNAVYQEFTNKLLIQRGYSVPLFKPEFAARNLARILSRYDFTIYEYFQTDIYGHKQNLPAAVKLIEELDEFTGSLLTAVDFSDSLIIITSDHGNIEDLSTKTHTRNLVPTFLIGCGAEVAAGMISELSDISPAIIKLLDREI